MTYILFLNKYNKRDQKRARIQKNKYTESLLNTAKSKLIE